MSNNRLHPLSDYVTRLDGGEMATDDGTSMENRARIHSAGVRKPWCPIDRGSQPAQGSSQRCQPPAKCLQLNNQRWLGWFIVGDAACLLDPLSSKGVLRAIMSGIAAGHLIANVLDGRIAAEAAADVYQHWVSGEGTGSWDAGSPRAGTRARILYLARSLGHVRSGTAGLVR